MNDNKIDEIMKSKDEDGNLLFKNIHSELMCEHCKRAGFIKCSKRPGCTLYGYWPPEKNSEYKKK
jgi:hypothetical protein